MRPVRLDVEGFTAFRDPVTIDFDRADLFVLTGPTGAGKSSVIDAMVFALYGCVPRLDRRVVAPIISLGRAEARVRFQFTLGDESYVATRVVRRTKHGASTREARLEGGVGDDVLAGNERELTAEIERRLGLGFEQFTKCVVLPQGEFMGLLHDEPAKRQDLLVSLLDIGLYETMARGAHRRAVLAEEGASVARRLLDKLAGATPASRAAAAAELAALEALRSDLSVVRPQLEGLEAAEAEARTRAGAAGARAGLLRSVALPDGLLGWSADIAATQAALDRCWAEEVAAERSSEQAEAKVGSLPGRSEVEAHLAGHEQRRRLTERCDGIAATVTSASAAEVDATAAEAVARAALTTAIGALERTRQAHRAHDLVRTLVVGQPCPVCRRTLAALPEVDRLDPVDAATAALGEADGAHRRTSAALDAAGRDRRDAETRVAALSEQISALDVDIGDAGASAVLQATLAEITAAEAALRTAAATDRGARAATAEARARLSEAVATEAAERRRFTETRDKVAALEPPGAGLEDLVSDWRALVDWAATMARSAESAAAEATREAGRLLDERTELTRSLVGRCAAAGIGGAGVAGAAEDVFEAVVDQVARVRADLARIDAEMAEAAGLRAEVRTHAGAAVVARDLARHLSANHFEKWVLDEALGLLVAGATDVLLDLSRGDYSLALDERSNFLVIDHRAADEVRSARTLSGGETFLASLALALALADQIGQLAAKGAARLESIFLDEGFGALDPDTLDTVAVAIEELGSRGRTVGLVTHLPELAERVPVRFDVVKGRATSTVVRTDT